jgi:hypothetical protein
VLVGYASRNSSGSFAMFAAIRRASSRVRSLALSFLGNKSPRHKSSRRRFEDRSRPTCAASGFFQCLVRHGGNEEFLFGLVDGVITSVRMVVHGNGSCGIYGNSVRTKKIWLDPMSAIFDATVSKGFGVANKNIKFQMPHLLWQFPDIRDIYPGSINVTLDKPLHIPKFDYVTLPTPWWDVDDDHLGKWAIERFGFLEIKFEFPVGGTI